MGPRSFLERGLGCRCYSGRPDSGFSTRSSFKPQPIPAQGVLVPLPVRFEQHIGETSRGLSLEGAD